jgi:hypothetical protein
LKKTVTDLMRIAGVGGGFKVDASAIATNDLMRIVGVASHNNARIVIENASRLDANDLMRIAGIGKGVVFFE